MARSISCGRESWEGEIPHWYAEATTELPRESVEEMRVMDDSEEDGELSKKLVGRRVGGGGTRTVLLEFADVLQGTPGRTNLTEQLVRHLQSNYPRTEYH